MHIGRTLAILIMGPVLAGAAQEEPVVEVEGLIIPLDDHSMYVRNPEGQTEVRWTDRTRVALQVNWRLLEGIKGRTFKYRIPSSSEVVEFKIPEGPVFAEKRFRKGRVARELEEALKEKWVSARDVCLHFGKKIEPGLPTEEDPRLRGSFSFGAGKGKPPMLDTGKGTFEVSMKKGGQASALMFGLLSTRDCRPFVNRAAVVGRRDGEVVVADEIHLLPIGDQAELDDPALPRYLYIGDSISGNYTNGLRTALKGKANLHHPPTNCGPTRKGVENIMAWLGAYEVKGRHWDVISFNFGHWDAGNTKEQYQQNLEFVVGKLKKTGAKLIWVTTCPVPKGYEQAGPLKEGKAPGRMAGVMKKYLNPWAAEVIARHPEITVCDQWAFVKEDPKGIYEEWWKGRNVHFGGKPADALGELLAKEVLKALGR